MKKNSLFQILPTYRYRDLTLRHSERKELSFYTQSDDPCAVPNSSLHKQPQRQETI